MAKFCIELRSPVLVLYFSIQHSQETLWESRGWGKAIRSSGCMGSGALVQNSPGMGQWGGAELLTWKPTFPSMPQGRSLLRCRVLVLFFTVVTVLTGLKGPRALSTSKLLGDSTWTQQVWGHYGLTGSLWHKLTSVDLVIRPSQGQWNRTWHKAVEQGRCSMRPLWDARRARPRVERHPLPLKPSRSPPPQPAPWAPLRQESSCSFGTFIMRYFISIIKHSAFCRRENQWTLPLAISLWQELMWKVSYFIEPPTKRSGESLGFL